MRILPDSSRRLAAVFAVSCGLIAMAAPVASAASADYDNGLRLGSQAYEYGFPLTEMERIHRTAVSVNVPDAVAHGPANKFAHIRNVADASERTINAPNNDTPYSLAWLDLSKEPMVLHAPAIKKRFWEFELVDPYTNNFYNITSAQKRMGRGDFGVTEGGDWAVVGPDFHGKLPRGVKRVEAPYDRVWIVGRTYLRGEADLGKVHRIQNRYKITPLSKFGTDYKPKKPRNPDRTLNEATTPGTQPGEDPLAYYSALGAELAKFPPPAADRPLLDQLKTVGIGPGLDPATAGLSEDTLHGLRDAVTQGPGKLVRSALEKYLEGFDRYHGYLVTDLGNWGTDYRLRALGAKLGIGGQRASIAAYPAALLDFTKSPLVGSKRYVLHVPAGQFPPPVRAFWSLTMYDANSFLVPNPLDRYSVNKRSNLHENPDGSIDIYVQAEEPSDPAQRDNWLPAPSDGGGFRIIWRLYDLRKQVNSVLDGSGWLPPPIQPCDDTGHAADGTACAS